MMDGIGAILILLLINTHGSDKASEHQERHYSDNNCLC